MAAKVKKAALAALLIGCVPAWGADAISKFCKPAEPEVLPFEVAPSMVVHDDTLAVTFEAAGIPNETGGEPDEGLFSFSRTIDSILRSARIIDENTAPGERSAAREAFVKTMIDSFDNDGKVMVNEKSRLMMPVEDRLNAGTGEGTLSPAALLDSKNLRFGMQPRALFNRFDLAPENWAHCGEYRIVYSIPDDGSLKRFFVIFEAMVPNPYFTGGDTPKQLLAAEAGCRPIAEYWAGLSNIPGDAATQRLERAKRLSALYYDGVDGVTTEAGTGPKNPVLSFRNFGGDKGRGQVRANMFFGMDWQLREWLTQLTATGLAFVPETVKDNPVPELYKDDLAGTELAANNIPAVLQGAHEAFVTQFVTQVQDNLLVEKSQKFREIAADLKKYSVKKSDNVTPITEDDLMVTTLTLRSDDRFNEFQSVSSPPGFLSPRDDPSALAGEIFKKTLTLINARRGNGNQKFKTEATDILINRAEAATCAGCHQSSPRNQFKFEPAIVSAVGQNGAPVTWPDVVADGPGFVHVDERQRLSEALKDHFLPVRKLIMGRELCKPLPEPLAGATIKNADTASNANTIDQTILDLAGIVTTKSSDDLGSLALDTFNGLDQPRKALIAETVRGEIQRARDIEQKMPGAFVDARRPH